MKKILSKTIIIGILCVPFLACENKDSLNISKKDEVNSESNMKEESPLVE